jgi:hypothetical protein
MNLDYDFAAERRKKNQLDPDDPRRHMLRAIFEDELDKRFMAWKAACKELGVKRIDVINNGTKVRFTPYQRSADLRGLMTQYWNEKSTFFPIRLPPKFWGEHFL